MNLILHWPQFVILLHFFITTSFGVARKTDEGETTLGERLIFATAILVYNISFLLVLYAGGFFT